jgi:hypothetical protein
MVVRMVKPEMIWWSLAVPLLVFALNREWEYVWMIIGFLLFVNTSVSIILGAMSAPIFLWTLFSDYRVWHTGLAWLIPGILLRAWRFLQAYSDGSLGSSVKEQARTSKRKKRDKLLQYTFYTLIAFLVSAWERWQAGLVIFVVMFTLYVVNEYRLKIADKVTLNILRVCSVVSLAFLSGSWWSLFGVCMIVLDQPFNNVWMIGGRKRFETLRSDLQRYPYSPRVRSGFYTKIATDYPWFFPLPFPDAPKLTNLLDAIPDYSRILLESDSDPRENGKFTRFHDWAYHYFADRNIEFVNHTFVNRFLEPALAECYLNSLSVPTLSAEVIDDVCQRLGVRYFIAFSESTASALQFHGYRQVMKIDSQDYQEVSDILYMPGVPLTLLEGSVTSAIISPAVTWARKQNKLAWMATAGTAYSIRYRYYSRFTARQGGVKLEVVPIKPFDNLPLRFMSVTAEKDGLLELSYG